MEPPATRPRESTPTSMPKQHLALNDGEVVKAPIPHET